MSSRSSPKSLLKADWFTKIRIDSALPPNTPMTPLRTKVEEGPPVQKYFEHLLKFGCALRLLPFEWNAKEGCLHLASGLNLLAFNFQMYWSFFHVTFTVVRLAQCYAGGEFSLLAALYTFAQTTMLSAFGTVSRYNEDVLQIANGLLNGSLVPVDTSRAPHQRVGAKESAYVEAQGQRGLSMHMKVNLFMLYALPVFHVKLVFDNLCAPNFFSSLYFPCESILQDLGTWKEKSPNILFEYYNSVKWQYVGSLIGTCLFMVTHLIWTELKKLNAGRLSWLSQRGDLGTIHREFQMHAMVINIVNGTFRYYTSVFPVLGTLTVALLIYGLVRFWRFGIQAVIMFPPCILRCWFEVLVPLAAAGGMAQESEGVLEKYKQIRGSNKAGKILAMQQRCVRQLKCTSGSFFSFGRVILLVNVDECINQAVNFLVTF